VKTEKAMEGKDEGVRRFGERRVVGAKGEGGV